MNPKIDRPPEDEPKTPGERQPSDGGPSPTEQEQVGPKTPEQIKALSEAVRRAQKEAEGDIGNA